MQMGISPVPGQERRGPARDLVLLLQQPDSFLRVRLAQFTSYHIPTEKALTTIALRVRSAEHDVVAE